MAKPGTAALLIMPLVLLPWKAPLAAQMIATQPIGWTQDAPPLAKTGKRLYLTPEDTASGSSSSLPPDRPVLLAPAVTAVLPMPDAGASTKAAPEGGAASRSMAMNAEALSAALSSPSTLHPTGDLPAVMLPPQPPRSRVHDLPALDGGDRVHPLRAVAFGLKVSTLGPGVELAIPLARKLNVRAGVNYLNWTGTIQSDGVQYAPGVKFTSGQALVDWFPKKKSFHLSLGAMLLRTKVAGSLAVSGGDPFSLGSSDYVDSVDDPVHGVISVKYGNRVAPMALLGFGNMLPRTGRHFSMPIELGAAYMQPPQITMQMAGTACTSGGCFNFATNSDAQSSLKLELSKIQNDIKMLKVYPIVSVGFACRF